jgi:hypothetical protein
VKSQQQGEEESQRSLQEIIPDIMIDGRFVCSTLNGVGAQLLGGIKSLVDVKTKSCNHVYAAEPSGKGCAVVTKRQAEVNTNYHKRVAKLDESLGTAAGATGPFAKELMQYGHGGRVLAPVIGAFAEMSPDTYAICDLAATVLAAEHCSFFSDTPSDAKALYTQRLYQSVGLAAHLGWARLLVDRFRDLVETPAATRHRANTGRHCSPDDEDAYEHENFFNPETPHHDH